MPVPPDPDPAAGRLASPPPPLPGSPRVPEVTVLFWAIKILSTGVGEAASDFLVHSFDPVPVVVVAAAGFGCCLVGQLAARGYSPWRYWLAVTMVAVFGTMAADATHVLLGIPYWVSAATFAILLAAVFLLWARIEGTISVHAITTTRRELLYWSAVLATFAFGTAFGDLTATGLGLGYLGSIGLFALLIAMPALAGRIGIPETAAFWWAYVLTRPLGASIADWLGVDGLRGGLGLGTGPVALVGLIAIVLLVVLEHSGRRRDADRARPRRAGRGRAPGGRRRS